MLRRNKHAEIELDPGLINESKRGPRYGGGHRLIATRLTARGLGKSGGGDKNLKGRCQQRDIRLLSMVVSTLLGKEGAQKGELRV